MLKFMSLMNKINNLAIVINILNMLYCLIAHKTDVIIIPSCALLISLIASYSYNNVLENIKEIEKDLDK